MEFQKEKEEGEQEELLNGFSLPEIKFCSMEWMIVFSSHYP
jgi:hypothetical protein